MIEFRISNPSVTPPGAWHYVQPESGKEFAHYSRDAFFAEIRGHRLANGYEITPSWKEEIEDAMCRAHAADWGQEICVHAEPLGTRKPISFGASLAFLNTMGHWVGGVAKGEAAFVDDAEAQRRAAICVTCPFNAPTAGQSCGSCADQLMRGLTRVIGRRSTPYDHNLGACAICSCSLAAAVHFPLKAQQAGLNPELRAEFRSVPWCWKAVDL